MSEGKTAEGYADAMARAVKDLVNGAMEPNWNGRMLIEGFHLDRLRRLSESYLDDGNVELWIMSCPRNNYIKTIKIVRDLLGLGLKAAKNFVDAGLPLRLKSYTSLVEVEKDEKRLSDAGIQFERRKRA